MRVTNEIKAMYRRPSVHVKLNLIQPFMFVHGLSNIASILFMHIKLRETGNQPLDYKTARIQVRANSQTKGLKRG